MQHRSTFISFATLLAFLLLFATSSFAATLVVSNTNDSGAGSLRAQIAAAATGDTIVFTGIAANATITLTSGQITFPSGRNLTLDASANNTITVVAAANSRVFNMPNDGSRTIVLRNLVVSGGVLTASGATGAGIAFFSGGSLTLTNCTVSGNSLTGSNSSGAGIYMGNAGGTISITGSTISGNSITSPNGQGAGLWTGVSGSITNSTISGNTSNANNSLGTGIYVNNSGVTLNMNHVTIALNTSTGNGSNSGGGIYGPGSSSGTIRNSIIARNTVTGVGPDISGAFTTGGYNLLGIGNGSTGFTNGVSEDQVGTTGTPIDPLIFNLANNGGPTATHGLGPLSTALDRASAAGGATTDQRGFPRPYDDLLIANATGGNGADIGAFEAQTHTAAGVGISGRVLTADGRGIARAVITLAGVDGMTRLRAVTNPFGYYSFSDLDAGTNYVLTVSSKTHTFASPSRIVATTDSITELDLVAEP